MIPTIPGLARRGAAPINCRAGRRRRGARPWLLPTDPLLDVTIAPPSGTFTFGRSFAAVPPHFALVLQSAAISPNGALVVGAPLRFVWE